jgi:predicted pyridoxine 5'-phosphate oxidase superfamily flavin-nucleotide-binding protein
MDQVIGSVAQLEACIGAAGAPVKMKIIDHLDATAARWIAASPVVFLGFGRADGPKAALAGGARGFAVARSASILRIARGAVDGDLDCAPGDGAGALFLIPGVGETLRANGRVASADDEAVEIAIEECFVHCAKALIRSDFWKPSDPAPTEVRAFVDSTRFLAMVTMDREGRIDVSPKGDPAGLLVRMDGDRATLAERPGNRLAFGYRNMIDQPRVAALGVIPGAASVVTLSGRAHLTTDEVVRAAYVVEDKTPPLATVIEDAAPAVLESPALARAALWPAASAPADIDAAATLVAHLKLNKARGMQATLLRLSATRGLVASGLKQNYKTDLY